MRSPLFQRMRLILIGAGLCGMALLNACSNSGSSFEQPEVLIQSRTNTQGFNTAANLMATALRETENLDIVLYPRDLVERSKSAVLSAKMDNPAKQRLMSVYPDDVQDQFKIGTMRGSSIKELIIARASEIYRTEIDVAGLLYHIHYIGGYPQFAYFSRPEGQKFEDDQYYRVAISNFFFFNSLTFPGYKYRNGLNFSFRDLGRMVSAKAALETYLAQHRVLPDLKERRAVVTRSELGTQGLLSIAAIQGISHRSPYYGQRVTTRGIVTAVGSAQWYPGGVDVVIQSEVSDEDPRTSEALQIYIESDEKAPQLGDFIEVRGVVYEQVTSTGLGMTGLRELEYHHRISTENPPPLPEPIKLGLGGRSIPSDLISTWRGNLNLKPSLDLNEGIDFWESLEGMRVEIESPRVVGFRGGQEDYEDLKPKSYLTLYVKPDGQIQDPQDSKAGGILVDFPRADYNPNLIQISTNHLTAPVNSEKVFNVGDLIRGPVVGVLVYQKNLFGGGEFNLVLPQIKKATKSIDCKAGDRKDGDAISLAFACAPSVAKELDKRGITQLQAGPTQLSIVTFNVENLGGNQPNRLQKLADAVKINLLCPDIVNFVEIQDADGPSSLGDASAEKTLERLLARIDCPLKSYKTVNIDPVPGAEGGQPGGNIRVAVMYDAGKVDFTPRGATGPLDTAIVTQDGHLSENPGRVFPLSPVFDGVRRSLVTEFSFRGHQILIIGNHLNSKLGDKSPWEAQQPAYFKSEDKRILLTEKLNTFVDYLVKQAPQAHVMVAGDFNALETETSMKVLQGEVLHNLIGLMPKGERYSTNYNGNSQCIDHILVNSNFMKRAPQAEIIHLNSNFMGRLSDHDPVISLFQF